MAIRQLEPYVSEPKMEDAYVERVPVDKMGIGANATGLPQIKNSGNMGLVHVGGAVPGGGKS